ncbi:hypothetical protein OKW40_007184 [Paraburkholderia sp. RAU6.4a]
MSHEIRTPLNAIMGNLELLSRSQLDALQRDRLTTIRASADGLLEVVSDVLDFSRSEAGEMRLERIAFDAQEVASRALLMFGPLARAKGVRLSGVFGTSPVLPMQGDPTRLGQVMNNLLANAIKFTAYGEVTLRLPSRQVTDCLALTGNCMASSFTAIGSWPGARRNNVGGLPRPLQGLGGSGAVPGALPWGHTAARQSAGCRVASRSTGSLQPGSCPAFRVAHSTDVPPRPNDVPSLESRCRQ